MENTICFRIFHTVFVHIFMKKSTTQYFNFGNNNIRICKEYIMPSSCPSFFLVDNRFILIMDVFF